MAIHPSAIVDPKAELDSSVEVGPFSVIGPNVKIGARTKVGPHVVIEGHTTIGEDNHIFQFASLGGMPQDKKYAGEETKLVIGDRNTIREFCTFNLGTAQDVGVTRLGNDNWIMAYVHLAHDCQVGNNTIFANSAQLAGHVHIGDWVILGGFTLIHQFCRIGDHAMTGFGAKISQDISPFVMASGTPTTAYGINAEGLRRRGFSADQITGIKRAYKTVYRSGLTLEEAKTKLLEEAAASPESAKYIEQMHTFISEAQRGLLR